MVNLGITGLVPRTVVRAISEFQYNHLGDIHILVLLAHLLEITVLDCWFNISWVLC